MRTFKIYLSFIFIVAISLNLKAQETSEPLSMTYLGGAGFLLESGTKKVLIDGVLTTAGLAGFITPSNTVIDNIKNAVDPFNNIDLFLVGHGHEDHFDAETMEKCMQANVNAKLICPQEALDKIKAIDGNNYNVYQNRVYVPTLEDYSSIDTLINGIGIKITKFPSYNYHPNGIFIFNINLNNMNILHLLGPLQDPAIYSTEFNDENTDILLVADSYYQNTNILENDLKFKVSFTHHVYNYRKVINSYLVKSVQLREKGLESYVLQSSMEKYRFTKNNNTIGIDSLNVPTSIKIFDNGNLDELVQVAPNPSSGIFNLSTSNYKVQKYNVRIFSASGNCIFSRSYNNKKCVSIDLSEFPKDIYIMEFLINDNYFVKKKVILN